MNKPQLIKELSKRTDYTQKDSKLFLDTLIEIFAERISRREPFGVYGFGKLQYVKLKPRKAYKPQRDGTGEYIEVPESEKIVFSLASSLKNGEVVLDESINDSDDFE